MPRNPGEQPSAVLTKDAYERLARELEELKSEGRTRMSERLQHARELGDLRENAEYDAAKNEQGLMEARIRDLERMLKDPDIVEGPEATDVAIAGVLVTLRALDDDDPGVEIFEFRLWRWAVRERPRSGAEGMVGEHGTLMGQGRVRIRGTSYRARLLGGGTGDRVVVEGVDGMTLIVRRVP